MMNLNKVATDLENDVEIKVLIDETADEAAEKVLIEKSKIAWCLRDDLFH